MASGLPVLSSHNVGAAEELLEEGVNGFGFDPQSVSSMAESLIRLASLPSQRIAAMGAASDALIEQRRPTAAFAAGLLQLLNLPPR